MRLEIPDHDLHAEQAALGAMIAGPEARYLGVRDLRPKHFTSERCELTFRAITELHDEGGLPPGFLDLVLLERRLADKGHIQVTFSFLADLFEYVPTQYVMPRYVEELQKLLERRELALKLHHAAELARQGDTDEARAKAAELAAEPERRQGVMPLEQQVDELEADFQRELGGGGSGYSSGMAALDSKIGGFKQGCSYILGGLTSVGKTMLALQWALTIALSGVGVLIWEKEMHRSQINRRLVSLLSGVPLPEGQLRKLTLDERERVEGGKRLLRSLGDVLRIDDTPSTLPQMIRQARLLRGKVGLVVVDHARLVDVPSAKTEYAAISAVSGACKAVFATEIEAACLLLSQFSRAAAQEKNGDPKPHQLRGSGALEEDVDVGMTIHRDRAKKGQAKATLTVWKNRVGGTGGTIELQWDAKAGRYLEGKQEAQA